MSVEPPRITIQLARVLPARMRRLACLSVHTFPDRRSEGCSVCGHVPAGRRRHVRLAGSRGPSRNVWMVEMTGRLSVLRTDWPYSGPRWSVSWTWRGDRHEARLRPTVSFAHRNVSRQIRLEQAERDRIAREDTA